MSWVQKASKGGDGGFAKAPPGNHPAVLVAIVDMGTQWVDGYQGQPGREQHRAYFVWELVTEKVEGTKDRNHLIAIDLTVSLNEKAKLRKWIEARIGRKIADGEQYDISKELGGRCLLNVVLSDKGHPKIDSVGSVPKGLTYPEPQHAPFIWSLTDAKDGKVELPDWLPYHYGEPIADVIKRCKELGGERSEAATSSTASSTAGQASAPAKPTKPVKPGKPAPAAGPYADRSWWVDDPDKADPVKMLESDLRTWASGRGLGPNDVMVMAEDQAGGWKTAADAGVSLEIPF